MTLLALLRWRYSLCSDDATRSAQMTLLALLRWRYSLCSDDATRSAQMTLLALLRRRYSLCSVQKHALQYFTFTIEVKARHWKSVVLCCWRLCCSNQRWSRIRSHLIFVSNKSLPGLHKCLHLITNRDAGTGVHYGGTGGLTSIWNYLWYWYVRVPVHPLRMFFYKYCY